MINEEGKDQTSKEEKIEDSTLSYGENKVGLNHSDPEKVKRLKQFAGSLIDEIHNQGTESDENQKLHFDKAEKKIADAIQTLY